MSELIIYSIITLAIIITAVASAIYSKLYRKEYICKNCGEKINTNLNAKYCPCCGSRIKKRENKKYYYIDEKDDLY